MMKFDHLNLPVSDLDDRATGRSPRSASRSSSRCRTRRTVALNDGEGFAIFLQEKPERRAERHRPVVPGRRCRCHLSPQWSARGVAFAHGPQKNFWGYGAELADPDGYFVRLWDERSMAEK